MKKIYKHISLLFVFIFTLMTCSACIDTGATTTSIRGDIELVTTPATTTIRYMNEALYLGYLGAQRDFALIVDNGNNTNYSYMTTLVSDSGIKASRFTGVDGAENLLIYYVPASEYIKFGEEYNGWFQALVAEHNTGVDYNDTLQELSCGYSKANHPEFCDYAKDMASKGKKYTSEDVGDSMILFFESGEYHSLISDLSLRPVLDDTSSLEYKNKYYDNMINKLKSKVSVSNATKTNGKSSDIKKQGIIQLNSIQELENLISGSSSDFLLLITSDGFIQSKVGTDLDYDNNELLDYTSGLSDEDLKTAENFRVLANQVSVYIDNCAGKSESTATFLQTVLSNWYKGTLFTLALASPLTSLLLHLTIFKKSKNDSQIADKNYCNIMTSALKDIEINVPIYQYNIKTANDNIAKFKSNKLTDTTLNQYYKDNGTCLNQATYVAIKGKKTLSTIFDAEDKYPYADTCEMYLVSNIVGGFGGSPSLQLYLNGKKADDLYGRVTTELIIEIANVWGLNSVGNLYSTGGVRNLEEMSFSFSAVDKTKISNMYYCISQNSIPSCEGNVKYPVYFTNNEIKIDIINEYKNYSRSHINEVINTNIISSASLIESKDKYENTYFLCVLNGEWTISSYFYGVETTELTKILTDAINILKSNLENMYLIEKNGIIYVLCDDGSVVGFTIETENNGNKKMQIAYFKSQDKEYIFNSKIATITSDSIDEIVNSYDYTNDINSAHNFYVYVEYQTEGKIAYYSYGF